MNKGAKAIIALALSLILYLGIYHIYRPQINDVAEQTFSKVSHMINNTSSSDTSSSNNSKSNNNDNKNRHNSGNHPKYINWNNLPKPAWLQDGYMKLPTPLPSAKYIYATWTWHKHDLTNLNAMTSTVKVISHGFWSTNQNADASYGSIPKNAKMCSKNGKLASYSDGVGSEDYGNITYVGLDGNTIVNNPD